METNIKHTTDMLEDLILKAKSAEIDLRKFDNGNIAAGIRARWTLQEVRQKAKIIRAEVQIIKKARRIKKYEEAEARAKRWEEERHSI